MQKTMIDAAFTPPGIAKIGTASRQRVAAAGFRTAAVIALLMSSYPASAQDAWLRDGKVMPDQPNAATVGAFGVMQIATDDPDRLVADWSKPEPTARSRVTTRVVRNRTITTFIVFKGCQAGASGNCNVTADFDVIDSGGEVGGQTSGVEVWVGRPPAPDNNLQLSTAGFGITFDSQSTLGAYRIRSTITDHVAGKTAHTEQTLTLVLQ